MVAHLDRAGVDALVVVVAVARHGRVALLRATASREAARQGAVAVAVEVTVKHHPATPDGEGFEAHARSVAAGRVVAVGGQRVDVEVHAAQAGRRHPADLERRDAVHRLLRRRVREAARDELRALSRDGHERARVRRHEEARVAFGRRDGDIEGRHLSRQKHRRRGRDRHRGRRAARVAAAAALRRDAVPVRVRARRGQEHCDQREAARDSEAERTSEPGTLHG